MNKLIKRIYFDDGEIQSKLDNAVETLQAQEVGTTQEVDGVTVTKQADDSFIAAQDGDVVNVAVTPEGLSVTEVEPESKTFSGPGLQDMLDNLNWNSWDSVQGELDELKDHVKATNAKQTLSQISNQCWQAKNDWDKEKGEIKDAVTRFVKDFKDIKLFDDEGTANQNVDIKTLMFSDEEIEASPSTTAVDIKTLMFSDEEIEASPSITSVDIKTLMFSDEELEASPSTAIAPVITLLTAGKAEGDVITLAEINDAAVAQNLSDQLQLIVEDLKAKGFTFDADATAKFFDDDEDDEDDDDPDDPDLSDPNITNAQLFAKAAAEIVDNPPADFDPTLSTQDLFKIENAASDFKSLEDECKDSKY